MTRFTITILCFFTVFFIGLSSASAAITAKLTVEISLEDGTPVEGAKLVATLLTGGRGREFETNNKGKIFAPFVDVGEYNLTIEHEGYFVSQFIIKIRTKEREIEMDETRVLGPNDQIPPIRFKADRHVTILFTLSRKIVAQPTEKMAELTVPAKLQKAMEEIKDYYQKEEFENALAQIDANLVDFPEEGSLFYIKGTVFVKLKKYTEAIPALEKALSIDPAYPDANYYIGEAYVELGEYEKAIAAYEKELVLNANNLAILLKLGLLEKKVKQYDKAVVHLQKCIELAPGDNRFSFELADILAAQGKTEEAQKIIDSLDMAGEHDAPSEYNLGVSFWNAGNYNLALKAFTRAAEYDPTMAVAHRQAGLCHVKLNEPEAAIKSLQKYLSLQADAEDAAEMNDLIGKLKKVIK